MNPVELVVVYHPNCRASTDFLIKASKLQNYEIKYINVKEDNIETEIEIDVVPILIVDNDPNKIFKGKSAFDKVDKMLESTPKQTKKTGSGYLTKVTFKEELEKKEKIDLSKK